MVATVVLLLRPLMMLLMVDWVTPLRVASRLMVIPRWAQSSRILARIAALVVIAHHILTQKR